MAIDKVEMYTVVCDNCGSDAFEGQDYCCYSTSKYAEEVVSEMGWIKNNEDHFCSDCWSYDDNDNLIIKHKNS